MYIASGIRTSRVYPTSISEWLRGENAGKWRLTVAVLFSLCLIAWSQLWEQTPCEPEPQTTAQRLCSGFVQPYVTQTWSRTPPRAGASLLEFEKHKTESLRGLAASHTVCSCAGASLPGWSVPQYLFWEKKMPQVVQLTHRFGSEGDRAPPSLCCTPAGRCWSQPCKACSFVLFICGKSGICSLVVF